MTDQNEPLDRIYYRQRGLPNHAPNNVPAEKVTITRVDLAKCNAGTIVMKFADGWTASTPPYQNYTLSEDEQPFDQMTAWFKEHGWTVHEWPWGARAWYGPLLPVRTSGQILSKRRQLERYPDRRLKGYPYDLAFDL